MARAELGNPCGTGALAGPDRRGRRSHTIHCLAVALAVSAVASAQTIYPPTVGSPAYPVPQPVESTLPVEGFRTRESLQIRMDDLALAHDFIDRHTIGATMESSTIYAFTIGDADDLAVDGTREPGAMVNGTIHAREWCSPEITTQLIEWFAANNGVDPIASYLVAQNRLAVVPILNIDGFDQTQRFWDREYNSIDGRMRRKNMRKQAGGTVDHDINTTGDNPLGTDLNRNLSVGFGQGSSASPSSDTYRGSAAFAEPETQALRDSVAMLFADPSRLRFYADMHGAIPGIYYVNHGTAGADATTLTLAGRLRSVYAATTGRANAYGLIPVEVGGEIGATDEYFGHTYSIPSFTIEYPTPNYRELGSGPTFILPADEVSQTVFENREALLLGFYYAAGPPIVERVRFWRDANANAAIDGGEIVHDSAWSANAPNTTRSRAVAVGGALVAEQPYRVIVQFNKPMRRMSGANAIQWTGQSITLQPTVALKNGPVTVAGVTADGAGWQGAAATATTPGFARYAGDTWVGRIASGALTFVGNATLSVAASDAYGHALDINPATVADWNDGWQAYDTTGGADVQTTIPVQPAQATPEGWEIF